MPRTSTHRFTLSARPKPTSNDLVVLDHVRHAATAHASNISTEVVTVTPALAYEWLEHGGENRPLTQASIERYARAMRAGEWKLTGESIKLDTDGRVRDGQHRLWACIEADTQFTTMVTINVPDDAFDVMDSGRSRTNADVVALRHIENPKQTASCARYNIMWDEVGSPNGGVAPSKLEVLKWLEDHPDVDEWVKLGRKLFRAGVVPGGESIWAAILYRLSQIDKTDAAGLAHTLITGANLEPGDAILALRNRLQQISARSGSRGRVDTNELAAIVVKAWNAWRGGRKLTLLKWVRAGAGREDFPRPV